MKSNWLSWSVGIGIAALVINAGGPATGARTYTVEQTAQQEPDNTGNNTQANGQNGMSADQQKETPADRQLAQKIRKSITSDKSLSTYAHNVKVIVRDGMVTLKGPVQSEDEKKSIVAKASEIAGVDKVQDKLTVKS